MRIFIGWLRISGLIIFGVFLFAFINKRCENTEKIKFTGKSTDTIKVLRDTLIIHETIHDTIHVSSDGKILAETLSVVEIKKEHLDRFWRLIDRAQKSDLKHDWYRFWLAMEKLYPETKEGYWECDDDRLFSPRLIRLKK
jgi:hypothetical protein